MRLNFSGVGRRRDPRGRAADRRGRARAGRALRHADRRRAAGRAAEPAPAPADPDAGRRAAPPAPRRSRRAPRERADEHASRCSRAGARWSARSRCARARACEDALERLGHEVVGIDVGHDLVARLREAAPDVAFVALHGRDGEDGTVQELLEVLGIPYTGVGRVGLHALLGQGRGQARHARRRACRRPTSSPFTETAFKELGAADALGAIEERLRFPIVVKPADQGSALGIRFAASAADVPAAHRGRLLLQREGPARAPRARPRARGLDPRRRGAADRRGGPARGGLLRLRRALHDRAHELRLPGRARRRAHRARPGRWRSTSSACSAAAASPASTSCSRRARDELYVLEVQRHPGADRDEPAAPGGRGRGDLASTS